jgi:hypothetical protein
MSRAVSGKRLSRVTEKISFRMVDALFKEVRAEANRLAGPLGQNAGYLVEYLLAVASSPTVSIPEIPIKMSARYLPEAIATLKCALSLAFHVIR